VTLAAIILAATFPWLGGIVWFGVRSGWSVLDGRGVESQATRISAFRGSR
jgi:hypothetical protein